MTEHTHDTRYITTAKGFAIILVVLAHTTVPQMRATSIEAKTLYNIIYSFHMPLYAILSGYLFELHISKYISNGYKSFALSKFKALIIPYLSFSIISYVGINTAIRIPQLKSILINAGYESTGLLESFLQIITHYRHIDRHMWFIYALFWVFIISLPLSGALKKPVAIPALVIILLLSFYFPEQSMLRKVPYLLLYFTSARHTALWNRLTAKGLPAMLSSLIAFSGLFILNSYIKNFIISQLISIACALAGSLFVLILSKYITAKILDMISKYSFDIYLLHQPFIVSGIGGILLKFTSFSYPVICFITLCAGIFLPILASTLVIRRVPLLRKTLLGFKN